jgi:mannose-6-phosphate isomerase
VALDRPLHLLPEYHPRVWGGQRLRPGSEPTGEAWIASERSIVADGPHAGSRLGGLWSSEVGGHPGRGHQAFGQGAFPLLIKLLDTADWLSVQVHPNDDDALRLEGAGCRGKTEAWHILEAVPGAQLIAGFQPGTTRAAFESELTAGRLLPLLQRRSVRKGDTLLTPAGALHALGPGLFVYEVQQSSDITYRVWDWDRPPTAGRTLHVAQSLAVTEVTARPTIVPRRWTDESRQQLVSCPYFALDLITDGARLETSAGSFHLVTAISGRAKLIGRDWQTCLERFETVFVPETCGSYQVEAGPEFRALVAAPS